MLGSPRLTYWDSCVFLSYINGEAERLYILDAFLDGIKKSNGKQKIVTSALSITEVSFAASERNKRTLSSDIEQKLNIFWNDSSVFHIIEVHEEIALSARTLMRQGLIDERSIKPPDAIHLASAQWLRVSEIHTYDDKWKYFEQKVGCRIIEPYTDQLRIPGV